MAGYPAASWGHCMKPVTTQPILARPVLSREAMLLVALCSLDMLTSAWLFHHNLAVEANPLLRGAAEAGTASFISMKALSFLPALLVAEWYRRINPVFVKNLLRIACGAYSAIYAVLVGVQIFG